MKSDLRLWEYLFFGSAVLVFLVGLLAVCKPPSYTFWKLSILVMEGGHFLVLPLLALGVWAVAGAGASSDWMRATGVLILAAAGLFASPSVRAIRMASILDKEFDSTWGKPDSIDRTAPSGRGFRRTSPLSISDLFTGVATPAEAFKTFAYKSVDGAELQLDFYPASMNGPAPCVIVVHGGGWDGGDRSQLSPLNAFLAAEGYAVASLQYRLAPKHRYPAPVEDLADAMAWLRGHAEELGVDTTRFAILGRSAGGQIALQAAYTSLDPSIKGVIAFYAPADMVFGYSLPTNPLIMDSRQLMVQYLGGAYPDAPEAYVASSPVERLSAASPPTLLLHGRQDVLVSWQHTVRMRAKLEAMGVRHFIVDVPWGAHGFDYVFRGPGSQISVYFIERFLAEVLK